MALSSLGVSFVVDEYNGPVEKLLKHAHISNAMSAFLQAAGPINLGFSLHMFLHFFIMNRRLTQFQYKWRHRQTQNSQPCPESSTEGNYFHINTESTEKTNDEREPLISRSCNQRQHHDQHWQLMTAMINCKYIYWGTAARVDQKFKNVLWQNNNDNNIDNDNDIKKCSIT